MTEDQFEKARNIFARINELNVQKQRFCGLELPFLVAMTRISPEVLEYFEAMKKFAYEKIDEEVAQLKKEMDLL